MTDESRSSESAPPAPPDPPRPPRSDPTLFAVGVTATVTGGIAIPVGGVLILADALNGVASLGTCIDYCSSSSPRGTIGTAMVLSGLVLLAVGIPMIVVGGKRVSESTASNPLVVRF